MGEIITQREKSNSEITSKVFNVKEMLLLAKACAGSGFYKDLMRDSNKALVKMMAGHELGFGPSASLTGIYIVKEKISLSATLIASLIKRSDRYDYKVKTLTDDKCEIDFYENKEKIGTSSFSMEDAKRAGITGNAPWKSYPRNMLFARALTNGQKWFCPDVSVGIPIYTPEELGAQEDENGEVIEDAVVSTISHPTISDNAKSALVEKLKDLVTKTGADIQKMLSYYSVNKIEDMAVSILQSSISLLEMRSEIDSSKTKQSDSNVESNIVIGEVS